MKCLICEREATSGKTIYLTEEEKALLPDPREEYFYCSPCWNILSNPVQGPALMKGLAQQRMRLLGVSQPIAEAQSEAYRQALVDKAFKSRSKS